LFHSGTVEQVGQGGTNDEPLIIAHRGASFHAPENTLAAFRRAIDSGADGVELDVRLARDGALVVIHDETLSRTALRPGKISDLTSDELNQIDVGSWFNEKYPKRSNPAFARETIPTLAQAMQMFQSFDGLIYIELKTDEDDPGKLSEAVCETIRRSPQRSRIIVKSFKLSLISEIKQNLPEVQTAALFGPTIMGYLHGRRHIIEAARAYGADQISLHHSLATRKLVRLASELRMSVTIWTLDNPAWLKLGRDLGVRALVTNDPSRMLLARRSSLVK
jgi:glycerophosphoryl diester phosphodiesterase